jgi:hypothetical protein
VKRIGVGASVGGFDLGAGPDLRIWTSSRLGFNAALGYYSLGAGDATVGFNFTVLTLRSGLLFRLSGDDEASYKVYLNAGPSFSRSTQNFTILDEKESESASDVGGFALMGVEYRFGKERMFGASGDLGYYTSATPFLGLQIGGFAFGAALHVFF